VALLHFYPIFRCRIIEHFWVFADDFWGYGR
jgi:hypothetical protein